MNPCTLGWYLPLLVKDLPGHCNLPKETVVARERKLVPGVRREYGIWMARTGLEVPSGPPG